MKHWAPTERRRGMRSRSTSWASRPSRTDAWHTTWPGLVVTGGLAGLAVTWIWAAGCSQGPSPQGVPRQAEAGGAQAPAQVTGSGPGASTTTSTGTTSAGTTASPGASPPGPHLGSEAEPKSNSGKAPTAGGTAGAPAPATAAAPGSGGAATATGVTGVAGATGAAGVAAAA